MNFDFVIDDFEGPLDLLLHLVKEHKMDLLNIKLEIIIDEYLEFIEKMEEMNLNIASSYLVMASELLEIKSKMLIPRNEEELGEDEVSSEEALINRLIEYQKYKDMVGTFKDLETDRQNIYVKSPEKVSNYVDEIIINNQDTTVDDLVEAFKKFLERKDKEKPITTKITNKEYSIKERKKSIRNILKEKKKVLFTELFDENNTSFIIVTFLSILEMTKEKEITIKQDGNFKDITIELEVKS